MTYVIIDTDGTLTICPEPVTHDALNKAMPSGWFDLVRLRDETLYSFVDDTGIIAGLPRNPVGATVLAMLGAATYAYAGPVVITGWQEPDESSELRDLTEEQAKALTQLYGMVTSVIAGGDSWLGEQHDEEIRRHAAWVKTLVE